MSTYPYVTCGTHGEQRLLGYCVCVHVLREGAPIAEYEAASPRSAGAVLCAACQVRPYALQVDDLVLVCERCVEQLLAERSPVPLMGYPR